MGMAKTCAVLTKRLCERMPEPGNSPTPIPGFGLYRWGEINKTENCQNKPIFVVTVQGAKRVVVGKEYRYGAGTAGWQCGFVKFSYLAEA